MYHKLIQEEIDKLEERITLVKSCQERLDLLQPLIDDLKEKFIFQNLRISDNNPRIDIIPKTIDDIKYCIRYLGNHRYFIWLKYESPEIHSKIWSFKHKVTREGIDLAAYFYKEGQSCKYVKTGTKTVDVMELQCSDGTEVL